MQSQAAGPVLQRLLAELRQPLQTLTSLADLLDLKAAALDASLRMQTAGFRDTVRHVDWLLAEAAYAVNPPVASPCVLDLRPLLDEWVRRLGRHTRAPVNLDDRAESSCVLWADEALLERFVANSILLADQVCEPDRGILLRLGHQRLHGFPALHLDLEASIPHVHASDFASLDDIGAASPLYGFSFALENCRRILEEHSAAVEFTDLAGPLLRLRVFFPLLSPEQAEALRSA